MHAKINEALYDRYVLATSKNIFPVGTTGRKGHNAASFRGFPEYRFLGVIMSYYGLFFFRQFPSLH